MSQTFVMFRYIETELDYYKGKRILELGSGTGILGIGVAKIGMLFSCLNGYLGWRQ